MKLLLASMVVLAVAVYGLDASHPCPQFWLPFNGNCYRYFGERVTWQEARYRCWDHYSLKGRADLVSIHTEQENAFAYDLFRSSAGITPDYTNAPPYYGAWIGAYQTTAGSTGPFIWSDGSGLNFEQWAMYQPTNAGGNEDCAHLWRRNAGDDILQSWNDLPCGTDLSFICKVAPN